MCKVLSNCGTIQIKWAQNEIDNNIPSKMLWQIVEQKKISHSRLSTRPQSITPFDVQIKNKHQFSSNSLPNINSVRHFDCKHLFFSQFFFTTENKVGFFFFYSISFQKHFIVVELRWQNNFFTSRSGSSCWSSNMICSSIQHIYRGCGIHCCRAPIPVWGWDLLRALHLLFFFV